MVRWEKRLSREAGSKRDRTFRLATGRGILYSRKRRKNFRRGKGARYRFKTTGIRSEQILFQVSNRRGEEQEQVNGKKARKKTEDIDSKEHPYSFLSPSLPDDSSPFIFLNSAVLSRILPLLSCCTLANNIS